MNRHFGECFKFLSLVAILLASGAITRTLAQGTSFTYQGRLQDAGTNANGSYDFQFTLWDALSGGTQQPQPTPVTVTKTSVAVANGGFTVQLDFGASAFPGADRFLEMSVRLAGGGAFALLFPRQPISSTPYAIRALSATTADALSSACVGCVQDSQINSVAGNKVSGGIPVASVPGGSGNYIQNTTAQQAGSNFNISGNGTAGGTLSGNVVNAATQYNLNGSRLLSAPGQNTFLGLGTGAANTTGGGNTFVGRAAGQNNLAGFENAFFGDSAGFSNIGVSNSSGVRNAYFGYAAGASSTAGSTNSFFGNSAGRFAMGSDNSFFGFSAGQANSSGQSNTGGGNTLIGVSAGSPNTTGSLNTFVGSNVGISNTTGNNNVFLGVNAGSGNASGNLNVFIGRSAGSSNTDQDNNTAIGAVSNVAAGITNATAIGSHAQVTQSNSLVLGSIAGLNLSSASTNVGIGTTAPSSRLHVVGDTNLVGNLTVSGNVGVGTTSPAVAFEVRRNSTVASDWQTGQLRISGASNANMQLSLGYDTSSNLGVIQAGQAFTGFKTLSLNPSGGAVGIGTTGPDQTLTVNGSASKPGGGTWLTFSDERLKNINGRFTPGLNAVMRLQPIRYQYKPDNALGIKSEGEHIGFGAQAVQKVLPEAVTRDEKGFLLVNNDPIMWTMLNAIKEQQAQIEQQRQQIEALKKLVCRSHSHAKACQ